MLARFDFVRREAKPSGYCRFPHPTLDKMVEGSTLTGWSYYENRIAIHTAAKSDAVCTQGIMIDYLCSEVHYAVALKDVNGNERQVYSESNANDAMIIFWRRPIYKINRKGKPS